MADQFGTIFISSQFDDSLGEFLASWLDTYLSAVEHRLDIATRSIGRPQSFNFVFDVNDKWPEDQLPTILVGSAGFAGAPDRHAGGVYSGWWNWQVEAIVTGSDYNETRLLTQAYAAAIRALVLQQGEEQEVIGSTIPLGEDLTYLAGERSRTLGVASLSFSSFIEAVIDESQGPEAPDDPEVDPTFPDWPTVTSVFVDVDSQELDD